MHRCNAATHKKYILQGWRPFKNAPYTSSLFKKTSSHIQAYLLPNTWYASLPFFSYLSSYAHKCSTTYKQYTLNKTFSLAVKEYLEKTCTEFETNPYLLDDVHDGKIAPIPAAPEPYEVLTRIASLLRKGANPETPVRIPYPGLSWSDHGVTDFFASNRRMFGTYAPPLYAATYAGRTELVTCLVAHKADVNKGASDEYDNSMTPLKLAVDRNYTDITFRLLEHNADIPSLRPGLGLTYKAADWCNEPIVKALLCHGAPLDLTVEWELDRGFFTSILNKEYDEHYRQDDNNYRKTIKGFFNADNSLPTVVQEVILSYIPEPRYACIKGIPQNTLRLE